MWQLIIENREQVDKKEKVKIRSILFFSEKTSFSKDMKAINYKMKQLTKFAYSSKGRPWDLQIFRTYLTSQKERKTWQK